MKSTDRKILILVASLALLLAGCGGGSSSTTAPTDPVPTPAETAIMEAETALTEAETALEMLDASATDTEMEAAYRAVQEAADDLIMVLQANGGLSADIVMATRASENAKYMADILAQKIEDDAVAADAAMTALAEKLYTAIGAYPLGDRTIGITAHSGNDTGISNTGVLTVQNLKSRGGGHPLEEDKTALVASLHGWAGSAHTATVATGTPGAGTYTAHMYSNVDDPTPGAKFNVAYELTAAGTANPGETPTIDTSTTAVQERVASPQFDQTAGTKEFELPANRVRVMIPGSYHGVSGTYNCTPTDGSTNCSSTVAADGFTLGGGTWTFKPGDPNALVTATPDTAYPVYGWWLHEEPDGTTTVSPFTSYRGTEGPVNLSLSGFAAGDPVDLHGTATYRGGAAGMYALQSSTGGTNDAGQFTADAELKATFSTTGSLTTDINHKIEGTIDNFMGSDGMSRNWSVALKEGSIGFDGNFPETGSPSPKTTWSIGGTAAGESGQWKGRLYKQDDGGVPTVGIGTFHSEYENIGRMVGAFGVNLEE